MEQERQRLATLYAGMSEGELQQLATDPASLTDLAHTAFVAEMSIRGLAFDDSPRGTDEPEFQDLVTIRLFIGLPDALLAKGSLESAGIESFLADDNVARLIVSNSIGGIRLRVRPEDAADAKELLDLPAPETEDLDGERDT